MALAEYGEAGYAEILDYQARMGDLLRKLLAATGWNIANETPLPVICFTRDGVSTAELVAELRDRQIAWMSDAEIGGVPVVRACITSFKTTEKDIEWVVSEINNLALNVLHRKTA
jgi:glutamate/tyrosine decarboxylase-like PLP-dependent enzyme